VPIDEKAAEKLRSVNVVVLHGDEEVAIQQVVQMLLASVQTDGMADLNLSRLDGRSIPKNELHNHLYLLPFGAERRLVILAHALAQVKTQADKDEFGKLLESLPNTTQLVMIQKFTKKGKRNGWFSQNTAGCQTGWLKMDKSRLSSISAFLRHVK
jgi:DNA polymerase III delta subunit